jgi:hypothetical protein
MANTIVELSLLLGFVCFNVLFMQKGNATEFSVGPSKSWGVPSTENYYNKWAGSNRFKINDSLVFVYSSGNDSVLEVTKEDYNNCSSESPIAKFEDGHSVFAFKRSGPFYFISGKKENCLKGEKLIVVVLADRSAAVSPPVPGTDETTPSPAPGAVPGTDETTPSPSPGAVPGSDETTPSPAPGAVPGSDETTPSPAPGAVPGSDETPPSPAPGAVPGSDETPPSPAPGAVPGSDGTTPSTAPGAVPGTDETTPSTAPGADSASTIFLTSISSIGSLVVSYIILAF